ncbi:MAG: hypothetical protein ACK44D_00920 [Bacteroidia bacterium]
MKYFLTFILLFTLSFKSVKAQQLIIKCGNNSITIDSTAKMQESFFSCDSIGFMVTGLPGEYKLNISKLGKKNPPMIMPGKASDNKYFKLYSWFLTDKYEDVTDLIVTISKDGKYVKHFKIKLNYKQDTY